MKKIFVIAGIVALSAAFGSLAASAKGKGGGHGGMGDNGFKAFGASRGLDRADEAAGFHGAKGRANARTRGAHKEGFCPPGQRKKEGLGSRFQC